MSTELQIPKSFQQTAIAFPDRVKAGIAKLETAELAGDALKKGQALSSYAQSIRAGTEATNHVAYGVLILAGRVGELCPASQGKRTDLTSRSTTEKLFHPDTLTDYRKVHRHQKNERIEEYFQAIADDGHQDAMSLAGFLRFVGEKPNLKAHQNKGVIEWYTPKIYIDAARKVMGGIDLDPCSNDMANEIVQAKSYYTIEDDGLEYEWGGRVWMNPPFQASLITKFVSKLCKHHTNGEISQAVLLTNNNTDTSWWHEAAELSAAICCTRGRVAFYNPDREIASPTNGHTFLYFGDKWEKFFDVFTNLGVVLSCMKTV